MHLTRAIRFTINKTEEEVFRQGAAETGMTMAAYARSILLGRNQEQRAFEVLLKRLTKLPPGARFTFSDLAGNDWMEDDVSLRVRLRARLTVAVTSGYIRNTRLLGHTAEGLNIYERLDAEAAPDDSPASEDASDSQEPAALLHAGGQYLYRERFDFHLAVLFERARALPEGSSFRITEFITDYAAESDAVQTQEIVRCRHALYIAFRERVLSGAESGLALTDDYRSTYLRLGDGECAGEERVPGELTQLAAVAAEKARSLPPGVRFTFRALVRACEPDLAQRACLMANRLGLRFKAIVDAGEVKGVRRRGLTCKDSGNFVYERAGGPKLPRVTRIARAVVRYPNCFLFEEFLTWLLAQPPGFRIKKGDFFRSRAGDGWAVAEQSMMKALTRAVKKGFLPELYLRKGANGYLISVAGKGAKKKNAAPDDVKAAYVFAPPGPEYRKLLDEVNAMKAGTVFVPMHMLEEWYPGSEHRTIRMAVCGWFGKAVQDSLVPDVKPFLGHSRKGYSYVKGDAPKQADVMQFADKETEPFFAELLAMVQALPAGEHFSPTDLLVGRHPQKALRRGPCLKACVLYKWAYDRGFITNVRFSGFHWGNDSRCAFYDRLDKQGRAVPRPDMPVYNEFDTAYALLRKKAASLEPGEMLVPSDFLEEQGYAGEKYTSLRMSACLRLTQTCGDFPALVPLEQKVFFKKKENVALVRLEADGGMPLEARLLLHPFFARYFRALREAVRSLEPGTRFMPSRLLAARFPGREHLGSINTVSKKYREAVKTGLVDEAVYVAAEAGRREYFLRTDAAAKNRDRG